MKKVKQQKAERPQAPVRQLEAKELLITQAGTTRTLVACACACAADRACDC